MANILSSLIFIPIVFAVLILLIDDSKLQFIRFVTFVVALVVFLLSCLLLVDFDNSLYTMQFVEKYIWIEKYNINYHLGIDGIALPLIILTTFSTLLVVSMSLASVKGKISHYLAAFLIMEGCIIGVFAALDSMLFYLFWEVSLIPMLLIIGIWGGENKVYAAIKFFLYTFFGSVFMLIALIYMALLNESFSVLAMYDLPLNLMEQNYIFLAFFLAFAVKIPCFPLHTWLPSAHVEAPTAGSVILAAIMLKMGGYGFLRFALPIVPDAARIFSDIVLVISLIAIVYIAFVALAQEDMKKLIAYSSVAHMGFVTFGIFAVFSAYQHSEVAALLGLNGSLVQMISHGFISAAMFLAIGFLYDRTHSRNIYSYGGLAKVMPNFSSFLVLFAMANVGLPATSGFIGEFMVILSAMSFNFYYAIFAATTLVFGAAYTLWMIKRVLWGSVVHDNILQLQDLTIREFFIFSAIAIMIVGIGVYPDPLINLMSTSSSHILELALTTKII